MKNTLEYKGFYGTVEYADNVLYGQVVGINSLISYEGQSVEELKEDFQGAVDDYLELCAEQGVEPEKMYKGSFNVRISPTIHKEIAKRSILQGRSLNALVEDALTRYINA